MELMLEAVTLFAFKLVHEKDGGSPILRDDLVMGAHDREVFGLLVRQGDLVGIQLKLDQCLTLALNALGGAHTVLGRELQRLARDMQQAASLEALHAPLHALKDYLQAIL